jgi:hypothetical protein
MIFIYEVRENRHRFREAAQNEDQAMAMMVKAVKTSACECYARNMATMEVIARFRPSTPRFDTLAA